MSPPRACGFVVLFPWSVKPVFCGIPWSPARPRTPRQSSTLGDVVVKDGGPHNGDLSHWYEEKISDSGRREWSSPGGPGLGMSILGTSRRYCADARKALSRLARSATDSGGGGNPGMMSRERRSGKAASSPLHSTSGSGRMPQLSRPAYHAATPPCIPRCYPAGPPQIDCVASSLCRRAPAPASLDPCILHAAASHS